MIATIMKGKPNQTFIRTTIGMAKARSESGAIGASMRPASIITWFATP